MENKSDQTRTEKIERIKRALADGTYQVLPAEIVRTIINHKRDLDVTVKLETINGVKAAVVFDVTHPRVGRRAVKPQKGESARPV